MELVVPAPAALAEVRTDAGNGDVDDGQAAHQLGRRHGKGEGDRSAPVVAHQMHRSQLQHGDEFADISSYRFLVVARSGPRRIPQPPHVWRHHLVFLPQRGHHQAPFEPALGPAVQQHQRVAFTAGNRVQRDFRQLYLAVCEFLAHELILQSHQGPGKAQGLEGLQVLNTFADADGMDRQAETFG